METQHQNQRSPGFIWGILLIGLGVIFLMSYLLPGVFGKLVWGSAFAVGAFAVFGMYRRNTQQWWLQIVAYVMGVIGVLILSSMIRFIPGELIGAFVLYAIGFPFFYVYLSNRAQWWALIPAYTMGAVGTLVLLTTILNGSLIASYVFFAIAAPFGYVYLNNRSNWWALIPAGIMGFMGVAFLIAGLAYLFPVALILVGAYLLYRQLSGKGFGGTAAKPKAQPQYGPEADHAPEEEAQPATEFEPLRMGQHYDE